MISILEYFIDLFYIKYKINSSTIDLFYIKYIGQQQYYWLFYIKYKINSSTIDLLIKYIFAVTVLFIFYHWHHYFLHLNLLIVALIFLFYLLVLCFYCFFYFIVFKLTNKRLHSTSFIIYIKIFSTSINSNKFTVKLFF